MAPAMSASEISGAALYAEREARLQAAIDLRQPDRVPVIYYSMFWQARYAGVTCRDVMYDYAALEAATRKVILDFKPDAYMLPHPIIALGPSMDLIGYRPMRWPGQGVGENFSYQYIDGEYMRADEYDDFIFDPTGYLLTKYLPRIAEVFEPFTAFPDLPAAYYLQLFPSLRPFAAPAMAGALERLVKAGEAMRRMLQSARAFSQEMAGLGFPMGQGATALAPYDYFADNFRGSKAIMLDMFRRKDKLLAAMEKAAVAITRAAVKVGTRSPSKLVFIPIHWGLDGFMSPDQFRTFFWTPLRAVMMSLIDNGLVPLLLWEGDVTSRLETIADIPRGKAIYWFERTDIFRAKAVLGDIACIRGNVPASMLTVGTPDEVTAYCRKLIQVVGKGGGFILDGAIGVPDEARPENVRAMFEAARTAGVYC
jgi:hypothetical protein